MFFSIISIFHLFSLCNGLKFSQECKVSAHSTPEFKLVTRLCCVIQGWDCLHEYVHREDNSLEWRLLDTRLEVEDYEGRGGWTAYYLNMTSQTWLSPEEVSRPVWWHILVVVIPHNLRITDMATLWVTDGSNNDDFMPDLGSQFDYNLLVAADIATASGIIVANLYQVPNAV